MPSERWEAICQMKKSTKYILAIIFAWMLAVPAGAQLTGIVLDKLTGDSIPFASLIYKGHHLAARKAVAPVFWNYRTLFTALQVPA